VSGIRVGSRVDQLLDLRRRVDIELELARREVVAPVLSRTVEPAAAPGRTGVVVTPASPPRAALSVPVTSPAAPAEIDPQQERPASCLVRVPLSLVAPKVVRDWANAHGLRQGTRGPVDDRALRAFVQAHS
jgi:hypothetical protein